MGRNLQHSPWPQGRWCTLVAIEAPLHVSREPSSCQACLQQGLTRRIFLAKPDDPLRNIGKLNVEKPGRWYRHTELASCQRMPHDYHALTPLSRACLSARAEMGNMMIA